MDTSYFNSPIGWMEIKKTNDVLTGLHFIDSPKNKQSPLKKINLEIEVQLENYFKHKPIKFNFSIAPQGTPFQNKIWGLVSQIKPGKTLSYAEIAEKYGNKKAIRAIGSAIGKNPVMIFIPCHRVIGSNGSMVGYAGGITNKKWLLEHEGFPIQKSLNL